MAELKEILFIQIDAASLKSLGVNKQGRNSNDRSRPPKYALTKKNINDLYVDRLPFGEQ
jgi:hypothetical protein